MIGMNHIKNTADRANSLKIASAMTIFAVFVVCPTLEMAFGYVIILHKRLAGDILLRLHPSQSGMCKTNSSDHEGSEIVAW